MEALKGPKCQTALAVHMINCLEMAMSWSRSFHCFHSARNHDMIEQLLHIAAIGAASHRLFFNLFNLFWLLLSMTFNVIAKTQCSCNLVLPTNGWHISVSIVLVSHSLLKTRLHASMVRFSKKNKPIQQTCEGVNESQHFYTNQLLHQTPFTPTSFYTRHLLHQPAFTLDTLYTRNLFTRHLSH